MPTPTNKEFNEISKAITKALKQFEKRIPAMEKSMAHDVNMEIFRLKKNNGQIANTVENMRIVTSIKNKIAQLLNTESYQKGTAKFLDSFNTITALQNQYWKQAEKSFKPSDMLREIREQAINDTAKKLGEQGIGVGIGDKVVDILRTNITSGGTYRQLQEQLRTALTQTETPSLLRRYVTQITTDSVHQYNAQYTQQVSSDLGYQWYAYQGSDIMTTRPFCNAMTDFRYFHISEIPRLLRGEGLTYKDPKTGEVKPVKLNKKTGLPDGMIEGTNTSNFFVRRGGYNCGHQIRPVSEKLVPLDIRNRVFASPEYAAWAQQNLPKPKTTVKEQQAEVVNKVANKAESKLSAEAAQDRRRRIPVETPEDYQQAYKEVGSVAVNELGYIERAAIKEYTGTAYQEWNSYLRGERREIDSDTKQVMNAAVRALKKLPAMEGETYRNMSFNGGLPSMLSNYKKLMEGLKPGALFMEKGFMSTTRRTNLNFSSPESPDRHGIRFVVKGKNGVPIRELSDINSEEEVLFPPGSKFVIESVETRGKGQTDIFTDYEGNEYKLHIVTLREL